MLLHPNGWLSDQHLGKAMQILYKEKLQSLKYEQHIYTIMKQSTKIIEECEKKMDIYVGSYQKNYG
jgi:hypothetical protein